MTENEINDWKKRIDELSHIELARLHRFAPSGHPVFNTANIGLYDHFKKRFDSFGGMTTEISKQIGW